MGQEKRRKYDAEFKVKIVMSLLQGEVSQQELGRRHDVSPTIIARWKEKFIEAGRAGLQREGTNGESPSRIEYLQGQLEKRDQVIGELTLANRLLKKDLGLD